MFKIKILLNRWHFLQNKASVPYHTRTRLEPKLFVRFATNTVWDKISPRPNGTSRSNETGMFQELATAVWRRRALTTFWMGMRFQMLTGIAPTLWVVQPDQVTSGRRRLWTASLTARETETLVKVKRREIKSWDFGGTRDVIEPKSASEVTIS